MLHLLIAQWPHPGMDPVFPFWCWFLLIPATFLLMALLVYLYIEQRHATSAKIVACLTLLRVILILLVAVLLIRPKLTWNTTTPTPETLWLVLDQSLSMAQKDKQATAVERIRWADALGLMPVETRPVKLDRTAARIKALHIDHDIIRLARPKDPKQTPKPTDEQADAMKAWGGNLTALVTQLENDPQMKGGENAALVRDLRAASNKWTAVQPDDVKIAEAWNDVGAALVGARDKAINLADESDTRFVKDHVSDPAVKEALDKVSKMRRADIAYAILTGKSRDLPTSMIDVLERQNTKVITFAGGQEIIATSSKADIPKAIKGGVEPAGTLTDLNDTLKFVADQPTRENERVSVLVVSDGRSNDGGDPTDAAKALGARGIRVYTLSLGSKEVARDAAVDSVEAPEWIYKDDTLTVSARIRLDNLVGTTPLVSFFRGETLLKSQLLTPGAKQSGLMHEVTLVTFKDKPAEAGVYAYTIKVQEMPDEVTTQNNAQSFRVTVKDDKLNVIVVQDQPRWEDRNIVNYLRRDRRVHLQQVLREPATLPGVSAPTKIKAAPTNEGFEAQLLPTTPEEWSAFDLIVLGDVPPDFLTADQQKNIAKAVTQRGTALLLMAGFYNMPSKYSDNPLSDLLPVEMASPWTPADIARHKKAGFRLEIAPEGVGNVLTRLDVNDETNTRYVKAVSDLEPDPAKPIGYEPVGYWHSEQTTAKPVARVLWRLKEVNEKPDADGGDALAYARDRTLLATMPAGYGRVVYLSSDSLWRMKYVFVPATKATATAAALPEEGVNLADRFFGQLVRWVVQSDLPAGGRFVRFGTSKARYLYGDSVVVSARLLNPKDFTPLNGQKFQVVARSIVMKDAVTGQVKGGAIVATANAVEVPGSPGMYRATLSGLQPGGVEIALQGAEVESMLNNDAIARQKTLQVDILNGTDREMRNVNADPATMARISQSSNGISCDIAYADVVAQHITNVLVPEPTSTTVGLFTESKPHEMPDASAGSLMTRIRLWFAAMSAGEITHWCFLGAFVVLITTEWILRKVGGLV